MQKVTNGIRLLKFFFCVQRLCLLSNHKKRRLRTARPCLQIPQLCGRTRTKKFAVTQKAKRSFTENCIALPAQFLTTCCVVSEYTCKENSSVVPFFGIHVQGKTPFFCATKKTFRRKRLFSILHFQYNFRNLIWRKKGCVHLDRLGKKTLFLSFDTALHHVGKTQTLLHVLLQAVYKLVLLTRKTNFHNVAGRLQTGQKLLPHALKWKHPTKHDVAVTLTFKIAVDNVASVVYGDLPCFGIVYGIIPAPVALQQHAVGQFFRQKFAYRGFADTHCAGNDVQFFHDLPCKNS